MKIAFFLQDLAMGGATLNAIELAARLEQRHGHDVVMFAAPGPMWEVLRDAHIRFRPAPRVGMHPSLMRLRALGQMINDEKPDLLYTWETWPLIDAFCAVHLPRQLPVLMTDMQMKVARVLPRTVPSTFGTPHLVACAKRSGMRTVDLLLPPVDTRANAPDAVDPGLMRRRLQVHAGEIVVAVVSRLTETMKGQGLRDAVDAIARLGKSVPVRLLIAGDGSGREALMRRAERVNAQLGRAAVTLVGAFLDPRPVYAAADIVIGMGGSALRGMAFGKPVIVVGEGGFAKAFTPESEPMFYEHGFYGEGSVNGGVAELVGAISGALSSEARRAELGQFGLEFVRRHFDLDPISDRLEALCNAAVKVAPPFASLAADALRTAAIYVRDRRFLWRSGPPEPVTTVDKVIGT